MILDSFLKLIKQHEFHLIPLEAAKKGCCNCGKDECASPAKHPVKNFRWKWAASCDTSFVDDWWSNVGNINIGLVTGRWSKEKERYLVVVDIDTPDHEILQRLPKTLSYRTGKKGHHLWFWSKNQIPNSVSLLANKVDIRGTNGYVVIPPSTHVNGNEYLFEDKVLPEIADLPDWAYESLKQAMKEKGSKSKIIPNMLKDKKVDKKDVTKLQRSWSAMSISSIKDLLTKGGKIPCGVRNHTVFRLLSSDRAKGVQTKTELTRLGESYVASLEDKATFSHSELGMVVGSVMKYQVYNTSHEKVNEIYGKWMTKNGFKLGKEYLQKLDKVDHDFFAKGLKPSKQGIPLVAITNARTEFLKAQGLESISMYKPTLLAQKLKDLGFTRTRTAKFNVWNVELVSPEEHKPMKDSKTNKREQNYPGHQHRLYNEKILEGLMNVAVTRVDVQKFLETLQVEDRIGLGFKQYVVSDVKKTREGDVRFVELVEYNAPVGTPGIELDCNYPLSSVILAAGFMEILYRDGKPYKLEA